MSKKLLGKQKERLGKMKRAIPFASAKTEVHGFTEMVKQKLSEGALNGMNKKELRAMCEELLENTSFFIKKEVFAEVLSIGDEGIKSMCKLLLVQHQKVCWDFIKTLERSLNREETNEEPHQN